MVFIGRSPRLPLSEERLAARRIDGLVFQQQVHALAHRTCRVAPYLEFDLANSPSYNHPNGWRADGKWKRAKPPTHLP